MAANGIRNDAHLRLTLTRGENCPSRLGTTLIIIPEWQKPTKGATTYESTKGISLISGSQRRNSSGTYQSDASQVIILDSDGYVSEENSTVVFMADVAGTLVAPSRDNCLPGISRGAVIVLAEELGIPCEVRRVTLAELFHAEETFTTGRVGEITPVIKIDGRIIGNGSKGKLTKIFEDAFEDLPRKTDWFTELPPFSDT